MAQTDAKGRLRQSALVVMIREDIVGVWPEYESEGEAGLGCEVREVGSLFTHRGTYKFLQCLIFLWNSTTRISFPGQVGHVRHGTHNIHGIRGQSPSGVIEHAYFIEMELEAPRDDVLQARDHPEPRVELHPPSPTWVLLPLSTVPPTETSPVWLRDSIRDVAHEPGEGLRWPSADSLCCSLQLMHEEGQKALSCPALQRLLPNLHLGPKGRRQPCKV